MVVEWVFCQILMNATMAPFLPLGYSENQGQSLNGVKFKICVNHVKTCTKLYSLSHVDSEKYTLLPTSNVSILSY